MGFLPFFGRLIRFVFIYKLNWKQLDKAERTDKDLEKYKNVKAGGIGLAILFFICVLYLGLTN
ncbi:MAG: hypothetical protein R2786_08930 [Flavobacteriaceae bacterium]